MVEKTNNITKPEAQKDVLAEHLQVKTDKVRTRGWKLFDVIVHGGINTIGNIVLSLLMVRDRSNYKVNQLVDAKFKDGAPPVADEGVFTSKLDVKLEDKKTSYLSDIPSLNPLHWGSQEKREANRWSFYDLSDTIDKGSKNFFKNVNEKANLKEDGFLHNLSNALGKYTGGVLFLSWGGHITNAAMWALESPKIKPRLVRALDTLIDKFVSKPSKERLETRAQIYEKLDSDLAGKSAAGVWGARFAGIVSVITAASLTEAIDVSITKADADKSKTGILRVSQGAFGGLKYIQEKFNENKAPEDKKIFSALSTDKTSVEAARANYFADQVVTEFMGTGITSATQYAYLMMRELFGVGPKTNVGDKKSAKAATVAPKEKANIPTASKAVETEAPSETKTRVTKKSPTQYTEKTKPVGKTHQAKARHSLVEQAVEQSI